MRSYHDQEILLQLLAAKGQFNKLVRQTLWGPLSIIFFDMELVTRKQICAIVFQVNLHAAESRCMSDILVRELIRCRA
jgi:hypothetical protein